MNWSRQYGTVVAKIVKGEREVVMIELVMGMQYGGEGKGSVVSSKLRHNRYDAVVRLGGSNAGHTYLVGNETCKMRQLPCGWQFGKALIIPSGGVIDIDVLLSEVDLAKAMGHPPQLFISSQAVVITKEAKATESQLKDSIGSTGSGTGGARALKIMRGSKLAKDYDALESYIDDSRIGLYLSDLNRKILVETAQGYGLSLDGGHYPFATSTNIVPFQCLADLGVNVSRGHHIMVTGVCRTFPIRVAGNSGPLYKETTWGELQLKYGRHIPTERTTVTNKIRRVGEFDMSLFKKAVASLQPQSIVLTFADYIMPELDEFNDGDEICIGSLSAPLQGLINSLLRHGCVTDIGIGTSKLMSLDI